MGTTVNPEAATEMFLEALAEAENAGGAIQSIAFADNDHPDHIRLAWSQSYESHLRYHVGRPTRLETVPATVAGIRGMVAGWHVGGQVLVAANIAGKDGLGDPETVLNTTLLLRMAWEVAATEAAVRRETKIAWYAHRYVLPFRRSDVLSPDQSDLDRRVTQIYGDLVADIAEHLLRADDHLALVFAEPKAPLTPAVWLHETYVKLLGDDRGQRHGAVTFAPHEVESIIREQAQVGRYPVAAAYWRPEGIHVEHDLTRLTSWGFAVDVTIQAAHAAFDTIAGNAADLDAVA